MHATPGKDKILSNLEAPALMPDLPVKEDYFPSFCIFQTHACKRFVWIGLADAERLAIMMTTKHPRSLRLAAVEPNQTTVVLLLSIYCRELVLTSGRTNEQTNVKPRASEE